MRAKICGIRNESDLRVALEGGADAIGLICGINHRSEDEVTPEVARRITAATPPFVSTVLVTCLLYTSPSPRDSIPSRMPSSA